MAPIKGIVYKEGKASRHTIEEEDIYSCNFKRKECAFFSLDSSSAMCVCTMRTQIDTLIEGMRKTIYLRDDSERNIQTINKIKLKLPVESQHILRQLAFIPKMRKNRI